MSPPPPPRRRSSRLPTPLFPPGRTPWLILATLIIWTAVTVLPDGAVPASLAAAHEALLGTLFGNRGTGMAASAAALRVVGMAHAVEAVVAAVAARAVGGDAREVLAWAAVTGMFGVFSLTRVVRAGWTELTRRGAGEGGWDD
ncbi:hypothetical protein MMPV_005672 [Pyropia vietnamensis]